METKRILFFAKEKALPPTIEAALAAGCMEWPIEKFYERWDLLCQLSE